MGDLFSQIVEAINPTGKELKDIGIQRAVDHADRQVEQWSDKAYKHFIDYCKMVDELKTEDARVYAEGLGLEIPPTKRAWGAIPLKAARNGFIVKDRVVSATNPKCHMGFTTVWKVIKDKINQP